MIGRRLTVAATRTLAARITKLEAYRPMTEEKQALVAELMEILRRRRQAKRMGSDSPQMLQHNDYSKKEPGGLAKT